MTRNKITTCLLGLLSACGVASLQAQNFDSISRSLDRSLDSTFERPETTSISSRSDITSQINQPPAAARMLAFDTQLADQRADQRPAGKNPVVLTPPSPWGFAFSAEAVPTYDTNPLYESTDGPNDWHLDYEVKGVVTYTATQKLSFNLLGIYNGARYDELTSEDGDLVTAAGGLAYKLRPSTTVKLTDAFTWGFQGGFGDEVFNRNRISLAVVEEVIKAEGDFDWSLSITPSLRWDSYDNSNLDRGRAAIYAELGRKITDKLSVTLGATEGYTSFDAGNHFWETELSAELGYQITKNVAVAARVYYLNRAASESGDFDQFTVAPVLGLSAKF